MYFEAYRVVDDRVPMRGPAEAAAGERRGRKAPRDKWKGLVPLAALAAIVGYRALPVGPVAEAAPAEMASPLPVHAAVAEAVVGYEVRSAYVGEVRSRRRSALAFERVGKIAEILVDEGDAVATGQPLVRIVSARVETALQAAAAERDRRSALLAELVAGPREEALVQARARLAQAEARRVRAEARAKRVAAIASADAVSIDENEAAASAAEEETARCAEARAVLTELEAGPRPEVIDAARAALAAAEATLAESEAMLKASTLRSPYDGVIARRLRHEGDVVSPGEPVLEILERDALEVRVGVPSELAARVEVGERVPIEIEGEARDAVVGARLPELDPVTRTVQVVLTLSRASGAAFAGQTARAFWTRFVEEPGVWVPTRALTRGQRGLWSLYRLEPEGDLARARRVDVELLHLDGTRSLVRGPIAAGDLFVAGAVDRVADGQLLVTVKDSAAVDGAGIAGRVE